MKKIDFNKVFSVFILLGMLATVIMLNVAGAVSGDAATWIKFLVSAGALAGVVNIVLSANGSIWNYLFGLIDVSATVVVSFAASIHSDNPIWGQFALHAAYFLPMQFIGFFQWRKRGATGRKAVNPRRVHGKEWFAVAGAFAGIMCLMYFLLNVVGNPEPKTFNAVIFMDTMVASLSILGQVMMAMALADQWFIWISVNISAIILYWLKSGGSEADSYMTVYMVKYIFYFINSLNGLRIWLRLSRGESIAK